ncbi:MAG: hypothetical protein GF307_13675 [candidate division Zixibacteria bacterium]|nr:hypothetical protein [candidate division Zixibacteria bacterium]
MAVYFISDAHFGAPYSDTDEHRVKLFSRFIDLIGEDADYLYIIGDLYDFWFEYRDGFPNPFPEVTSRLKELGDRGAEVIFIGGNHDWWAGKTFKQATGARIEKKDIEVTHYGKRIFIGHGDGIPKDDWAYRILRKILRNPVNIWLFSRLSAEMGMKLARLVSSRSHALGQYRQWKFLGEYKEYAQKRIDDGFDIVILGHTHIPQEVELKGGHYFNSGNWIRDFTYVKLDESGFYLNTFKNGDVEKFDFDKMKKPE